MVLSMLVGLCWSETSAEENKHYIWHADSVGTFKPTVIYFRKLCLYSRGHRAPKKESVCAAGLRVAVCLDSEPREHVAHENTPVELMLLLQALMG